jgi:predicted ATPase/DNA-binding CsgD family transcriptional regulator
MKNSDSYVDNLSSPHRRASHAFHYQKEPDRLGMGEQNAPPHRHISIDSHAGSGDAGRCAVVTVDKELFADTLPTYLTRFIGRERELAELTALSGSRLLTICGVGGLGKTRLAIELAKSLRAGEPAGCGYDVAYWVPLGPVADPADVPAEVAARVGLRGPSGANALLAVVNALRDGHALLVLDNCEHVASACAELAEALLTECAALSILATSRIALVAAGEQVYAVPPMGEEAVDLFIDRATSVAPTYALTEINADPIGRICAGLDGLPLAVELAASWVRVVSPLDLLARLERTMTTASPGVVEDRHRSLQAVLDSTWRWLSESDRSVATALGAFRGGFTREAAEYVAGASLPSLATLTERALIQRLPDAVGGSRYQMHELVRRYAVDSLEAAGGAAADAVRSLHFDYFVQMAERLDTPTHTVIEPTLDSALAAEQSNLAVAMDWALDRGDAERALRITDALDAFWVYSVPRNTNRVEHLMRALAIPWTDSRPTGVQARGKALNRLGYITVDLDPDRARELHHRALELFRSVDDGVGIAASVRAIGWADYVAGDLVEARRHLQEGLILAHAVGDTQGEAWSHRGLGTVATLTGDLHDARTNLAQAVALFERNRGYFGVYRSRFQLAEAFRTHGQWLESIENLSRSLDLQQAHSFTTEGADLLECLALTAGALHRGEMMARLAGAGAAWRASHDEPKHAHHRRMAQHIARMRAQLSEDAWSKAYTEGARLSAEAAVQLAYAVMRELTVSLAVRPAGLTEREIEVLRLVVEGMNNVAIADKLTLSPRTVHAHLRSIFDKLKVTSRTAAAHEAVRLNLAGPPLSRL